MTLDLIGGASVPPSFPRMTTPAQMVDALSWYDINEGYGLSNMQFEARDEIVSLMYPHPDNPNLIGVPRTLAPIGPNTDDRRSAGERTFTAKFTSELRPEQKPFCRAVYKTLENEMGCIGEAPTGFGKTVCGAALIAAMGRPTCIVIPKGDLDWTGEILKHTDIPENKIDTWQGQRLPDPEAWVVVAMLQSIYRSGVYPAEVYNRFACVMFDEVHRLGAPEFNAAARKFPAYFRLGLSATADRRDGKMDLIHSHIGWRHVVGHSDAEQPDYYVIPSAWQEPVGKNGKVIKFDPARSNYAERRLISDPIRNAAIAGATWRASNAGRRTIVFVKRIDHGKAIREALHGMGVPHDRVIEYNGGVNAKDAKRAKECPAGLILIATYKYTAEGTNIPPLDCAVLAHPIYDPRQTVGRITRKLEGKPKPIVLDVWDQQAPSLSFMASKRWEFLRKLGATWKGTFS